MREHYRARLERSFVCTILSVAIFIGVIMTGVGGDVAREYKQFQKEPFIELECRVVDTNIYQISKRLDDDPDLYITYYAVDATFNYVIDDRIYSISLYQSKFRDPEDAFALSNSLKNSTLPCYYSRALEPEDVRFTPYDAEAQYDYVLRVLIPGAILLGCGFIGLPLYITLNCIVYKRHNWCD